jgi:1-acyl-sn-glycerol-3-phosphate acyltransferase
MRTANDDFDPAAARASLQLVRSTVARYFRLEAHGTQNIPRGRCMVVGCHSGVLPYDAACTLAAIEEHTGRLARAIGDELFGRSKLVEAYLRRRGAIVGKREEAAAVLRRGNILLVFPGGAADMTRPIWRDAYRVLPHKGFAHGRGGYIKIALATRTPIVPLAVVGAEEAHVMLGDVPPVARLVGVPFFPVLAFWFPLPVKLYVRFGKPIHFRENPAAANDQAVVDRLNKHVRRSVQALIDDTLRRRTGIIWSTYDDGPEDATRRPRRKR